MKDLDILIFENQVAWITRLEDFRDLANQITPENKELIILAMDELIAICAEIVERGR